ncbi:MAG: phosphoenolpyruvate--protein phosphotransferase [Bdellovibrionota bacterium]
MLKVKGKGASPGTALGTAFVLKSRDFHFSELKNYESGRELLRWKTAHAALLIELKSLKEKFETDAPVETRQVIEAHQMMAEDPEWTSQIEAFISQGHQCEYAVHKASEDFAQMIEALDDPYLRQRAQDIRDVAKRVFEALDSQVNQSASKNEDYILVAEDLLPSDLLSLYSKHLKGIVLEKGNPTSHTTILTRTFEIPLVLKVDSLMKQVRSGEELAVDGLKGSLVIAPTLDEKEFYKNQILSERRDLDELARYTHVESVTTDGVKIEVASNLNSAMDLDFALRKGTEGVGLFRTEFLLMDRRQSPSEDEQFQIYKKVVESLKPHRTVIRTFDIGGDKQVEYLKLPKEENPFLGCRGIRFCLKEKEFFKVQLRALLRAAQFGHLGIMIPMLSRIEELLEFKELLRSCSDELKGRGEVLSATPEIGIMIEVPSAALIADQLAEHLDFMSVGTNDLVQYFCAADRMNSAVADLHDSYHPGLIRLLKHISESVKGKNVWLGMCGELAAQEDYIPLLIALGFTELSVSPGALLRTRRAILSNSKKASAAFLDGALSAKSSTELKSILSKN